MRGDGEIQVHINLAPAPYAESVLVEEQLDSGISDDPREAEAFSSNVLDVLPLPKDRFQQALPLLPGVVRDPRGRLNFNGTRASQSALFVNGSTATDPLTGEFAVEFPLKAVEAVQVHTIPYSAEFGRVTGTVANVVTQAGGDRWDVDFGNLFPSFRFRNGKLQGISSATPQVRVSGPLREGKAWISQGFAYRFVRSRVEDAFLPGVDEEILESFDSFTQLDLKLNERHSLTATSSFFPVQIDNLGIATLHPEKATPDFQSDGWNLAVSDRYVATSNTVWETLFAVRRFDVAVQPKGEGATRLTVDALRQNYFNEVDRVATQAEFKVSRLHFTPSRLGPHLIKAGGNVYYTSFKSVDRSSAIDVLRADGTRSRRIEFVGSGEFSGWDLGLAGYIQDQWRPSPRFGVDLGLRYEFNRITTSHHLAPRIAVAYSPGDSSNTVLKGGFGVFFDHVFVHAGSFDRFQQRTETFHDQDGVPLDPPLVFRNQIAACGLEVPRSNAWHVEVNRALGESWILRAAYRERRGSQETEGQSPTPRPVSGRPLSLDGILPADVLARVELVGSELELIRFEMGQPLARPSPLTATEVVPHQTLYQALTLFRNANQLYLEVTGDPGSELVMDSPDDTRPLHVWKIVSAAYSRLVEVKHRLGIEEQVREEPKDMSTTPADVFHSITDANRQLQILIRNRITTNDVFQQVALAAEYASRVLQHFPDAKPQATPPLERGKRPVDVNNLLVSCYARVYGIITKSGFTGLKLGAARPEERIRDPAQIRPSEVYDVATLLVSELAYLHAQLENAKPPVQTQVPGLKIPSHVHQKARLLLLQLTELEERVVRTRTGTEGPIDRLLDVATAPEASEIRKVN